MRHDLDNGSVSNSAESVFGKETQINQGNALVFTEKHVIECAHAEEVNSRI